MGQPAVTGRIMGQLGSVRGITPDTISVVCNEDIPRLASVQGDDLPERFLRKRNGRMAGLVAEQAHLIRSKQQLTPLQGHHPSDAVSPVSHTGALPERIQVLGTSVFRHAGQASVTSEQDSVGNGQ